MTCTDYRSNTRHGEAIRLLSVCHVYGVMAHARTALVWGYETKNYSDVRTTYLLRGVFVVFKIRLICAFLNKVRPPLTDTRIRCTA
jgi:hypothetical protein